MTKEEFYKLWTLNYPNTVLISYLFKHNYSERWFRIHSLPKSKRYPENDSDWKILLARQNQIISDLFGDEAPVFLVKNNFIFNGNEVVNITDAEVFKSFNFTKLDNIELWKLDPKLFAEGVICRPAYTQTSWKCTRHDNILREIADDKIRAFFVSIDFKIIVAPYDGGVDIILKDKLTKEYYKNKYAHWIPENHDGL
jgi:hypothetical protein